MKLIKFKGLLEQRQPIEVYDFYRTKTAVEWFDELRNSQVGYRHFYLKPTDHLPMTIAEFDRVDKDRNFAIDKSEELKLTSGNSETINRYQGRIAGVGVSGIDLYSMLVDKNNHIRAMLCVPSNMEPYVQPFRYYMMGRFSPDAVLLSDRRYPLWLIFWLRTQLGEIATGDNTHKSAIITFTDVVVAFCEKIHSLFNSKD
jgi:hypothetical protein